MPRFSTYRPTSSKPPRAPESVSTATPRQRLITCLILPIWLLVVINVHSAIAFYQELDDSVLIEPATDAEMADIGDSEISPADAQQLAQKFFIEPDINGNVNGRLTSNDSDVYANLDTRMTVVLLQNGNEIRKVTTSNGDFTFNGVPTGLNGETYTLVAYGSKGFLAETINVRKSADGNTSITVPGNALRQYVSLSGNNNNTQDSQAPEGEIFLPDLFQVVPNEAGDIDIVNEAPMENLTYHVELVAAEPGYNRLETIYDDHVPSGAGDENFDYSKAIDQKDLELFGCHEYELVNDGEFCGRIVVPQQDLRDMSSMQVVLTDRNRQIAEVVANEDGSFTFSEINPGSYTLVAAGNEGFGAVAVRLVDNELDDDVDIEADDVDGDDADEDDAEAEADDEADPFDEEGSLDLGKTRVPTLKESYVAIQDGSSTRDFTVQDGTVVQDGSVIVQDGLVGQEGLYQQDGVVVQEGIGVQEGIIQDGFGVPNNFDPCGCCRLQLVCQPNDVQYIGDVISDLNVPNYAQGAPNFPGPLAPSPIEFAPGFASAPIGPAPSFGFSAPAAVAPSVGFSAPAVGFGGGGGGILAGLRGSRLARLAIAGGIVAIAVDGDGDDIPTSPNDL